MRTDIGRCMEVKEGDGMQERKRKGGEEHETKEGRKDLDEEITY